MRNQGHEDGTIPADEVAARRLTALIYREYLDPQYLVPKPDKIIAADINEPAFPRRVPGTVIYARPGDWLRIHVKNADGAPHSFHIHGVRYGIDSDGSWPFGTQSDDGRRSDEICPGQTWTYTYEVTEKTIGAWPFHDHYRNIGTYVNRGLFGGLVVLPDKEHEHLPRFPLPPHFEQRVQEVLKKLEGQARRSPAAKPRTEIPPELAPYLNSLDELAHAPQPLPPPEHPLHVPLFFHQMNGFRGTPVFQSAPLNPGRAYTSPVFTVPATYNYICGVHGAIMSGSVTVQAGGPSTNSVAIVDFAFNPANVTVGIGGQVTWTNSGPSQHSVIETGGNNLPSFCFNGRSFVGNTPTIVAHAGQRIRWYVFNLDLGMNWHNFHPHGQRLQFANQTIDVRSIGPAESFLVETEAPPVLLLPPEFEHCHRPHQGAKEYHLRGDFLVHSHVEVHMMQGLVALLRSRQTVYLTPQEAQKLGAEIGLALDTGNNASPAVRLDRFANAVDGAWELLPGLPDLTFMHAVLLANSSRLLFWGYGQRDDQSRLWDQTTGLYTEPTNQPIAVAVDENLWSGAHAHLNDEGGTVLVHGGFITGDGVSADTERRAFLFDPTTNAFAAASDLNTGRFYPTTITLADGSALTLFGEDHANAPGTGVQSLEIFTPGGAGAWSAPKTVPFNYFYYPWTFLLPGGDLFIAGPEKPARRFDPSATPIVDDPAKQYDQLTPEPRGVNMDGTAVLLPLRPPNYEPRVLIAGGISEMGALQSAEWIDLSVDAPVWQALPDMNVARDKVNSVLLPDGRVLILGGVEMPPDGGPVEIFDPENPTSGFQLGPNMTFTRAYHSAAILLPDGSVIMGGDPNGQVTPNERYLPSYFFKPRATITDSPATIAYGATFSVNTPTPGAVAEVVLMRPGAVTHGFNQNQRYVGCAISGRTDTTVDATAPADGNIAPPGYYLLFLVDQDRVPSVAKWIRLNSTS
jgi:plastocyanin